VLIVGGVYTCRYNNDPEYKDKKETGDLRLLSTLWSHALVKRPENHLTGVGVYGLTTEQEPNSRTHTTIKCFTASPCAQGSSLVATTSKPDLGPFSRFALLLCIETHRTEGCDKRMIVMGDTDRTDS
jgi:hypothetical protein